MNYSEEITMVRQKLADLNAPPRPLEHTVYEERDTICDRNGVFKQRCRRMALHCKRIETRSECPACLTEKLPQLEQAEAEQENNASAARLKRSWIT